RSLPKQRTCEPLKTSLIQVTGADCSGIHLQLLKESFERPLLAASRRPAWPWRSDINPFSQIEKAQEFKIPAPFFVVV
ncbi:MAG: hypothetical protein WBA58_09705, partial [Giesbergeria sp.]